MCCCSVSLFHVTLTLLGALGGLWSVIVAFLTNNMRTVYPRPTHKHSLRVCVWGGGGGGVVAGGVTLHV